MKRKSIGIWCSGLTTNQLSLEIITGAEKARDLPVDILVFVQNIYPPPVRTNLPTFDSIDIYDFPGAVVATNIELAHRLLSCPGPKEKYFYDHILSWVHAPQKNYEAFEEVYGNENLALICRSEPHRDIIKSTWGRDAIVVNQNNLVEDLYEKVL